MSSTVVFIAVIAVIVILCLILSRRERRKAEAALRNRLLRGFGRKPEKHMRPERYAHVPAYYRRHIPPAPLDDITWNDLDMDAVYERIDATLSSAGEEVLYALLRSPVQSGSGLPTSAAADMPQGGGTAALCIDLSLIRWLEREENTDNRVALQMALARMGHAGRYSVYDYLELLKDVRTESNLRHVPAFLLPAAGIALLFVSVPAGVAALIAAFACNMVTYYRRRGEVEPYIVTFAYLLRMMRCADEVCAVSCPVLRKEQEELAALNSTFARFRRHSGILLSGSVVSSGSPVDFVVDYIRILFHIDLIKFNTMLSEARLHEREIDREMLLLGRLDAAISLASFEKSLPYTCVPAWRRPGDATGSGLRIEEVYHPLLDHPVSNSIEMDRCVLLTGSNASGKSTFLKSVALCALLAQTAGFCPARSYEAAPFRICSSMAIRDSIRSGESYFMVEIRSLKRMMDMAEDDGMPVLCCIDEVLRGTNTVERIAAASELLRALSSGNAICLAATHDIELTTLLEKWYDNYHFEETLSGGDVVFPYRLCRGRATARNAIRLLAAAGFDSAVTAGAEELAQRFEETGRWPESVGI